MKTLFILTSALVLATGCASHKTQTAPPAGAAPVPVTTETGMAQPQNQAVTLSGSSTTGYTTAPQPGQTSNNGWYTIPAPAQ